MDRPNVDQVGSVASFACAVHCVLSGLFLGVLSTSGLGFVGSPIVEAIFLTTTVSVGAWAAWSGFRRHRNRNLVWLLVGGFLGLILAHVIEPGWPFSVIGGVLLITFHIQNQRLTPAC